jgi:3-oxoacyl-[acyl-carrier protein] reductase
MPSGSSIIFLSTSINHASTVTPVYLAYCTSKGAIEQMVHVMSKDLAAKGVSVNAVAPGPTATDLFLKGKSEQMIKTIAGSNPHNRLGKPEEIADVLCWLSGSGSDWITGQVIRANGGMV